MPEAEMLSSLRNGRAGKVSGAASNVVGGFSKLEQLCILKDSKPVSWLKLALEIEINFGQFSMLNDIMPLRFWNAKIRSSSTLDSLDTMLTDTLLRLLDFIDSFPWMEICRT